MQFIEIKVLSWSRKNPGISYPGFCSVIGDGKEESPYFVTCFGKALNSGGSVCKDDYIVAFGFSIQAIEDTAKSFINAAVPVAHYNEFYALSGAYAYYYSVLRNTSVVAGEWIILSDSLPEYSKIESVAEDSGIHVISLTKAESRTVYYRAAIITGSDIEKCLAIQDDIQMIIIGEAQIVGIYKQTNIRTCPYIGQGFNDLGFQKGIEVYPEHYVRGMVKHNILNACDYIDKHGINEDISLFKVGDFTKVGESSKNALKLKKEMKNQFLQILQQKYKSKFCSGLLEIMDSRLNSSIENTLSLAASVSMCGIRNIDVMKNSSSVIVTGNLDDGTLLSILKTQNNKEIVQIRLHIDSYTYVLDLDGLKEYDYEDEKKLQAANTDEQLSFTCFEDNPALNSWKELLTRIDRE